MSLAFWTLSGEPESKTVRFSAFSAASSLAISIRQALSWEMILMVSPPLPISLPINSWAILIDALVEEPPLDGDLDCDLPLFRVTPPSIFSCISSIILSMNFSRTVCRLITDSTEPLHTKCTRREEFVSSGEDPSESPRKDSNRAPSSSFTATIELPLGPRISATMLSG